MKWPFIVARDKSLQPNLANGTCISNTYQWNMYQNILSFGTCYKKRDRTPSKSSQSPKPLPCKAFSRRTKSLQTRSIFGDHQKSKRTCSNLSGYCIRRRNMFHFGRGSIRIPYLTCSILARQTPKKEHVSEYLMFQK